MSVKPSPQVAQAADYFEAALKDARIPEALENSLWDVWVENPQRAAGLVARFKDNGATPAVRLKQAPADEFDTIGTKFAMACRDMATRPGGDKLQVLKAAENMIAQMSGQTGGAGGSLSDTEKAARGDFLDGPRQVILRTRGHII